MFIRLVLLRLRICVFMKIVIGIYVKVVTYCLVLYYHNFIN